jgi:hypothetical protein
MGGAFNSEANLASFNLDEDNTDIFSHSNGFIDLSGEYEHGAFLGFLVKPVSGGNFLTLMQKHGLTVLSCKSCVRIYDTDAGSSTTSWSD